MLKIQTKHLRMFVVSRKNQRMYCNTQISPIKITTSDSNMERVEYIISIAQKVKNVRDPKTSIHQNKTPRGIH